MELRSVLVAVIGIYILIDNVSAQLSVGDRCLVARTGGPGECRLITKCPAAVEDYRKGLQPATCGFMGSLTIVCCPVPKVTTPPPTYQMSDRISARKCAEYAEAVYENISVSNGPYQPPIIKRQSKCAIVSVPFIVGGEAAAPREFPHMALLGYQPDPRTPISYECGGSLISENFVLTAAHCISPNRLIGDVKFVLLGEYVLDSREDDANPMLFNVIERFKHEEFKMSSKYNDIALVRLDRNVPFSQYIRPACLSETYMDATDAKATASGWGRTENRGKASTILMKVVLELFTDQECTTSYMAAAASSALKKGIVHEQQFCAGDHTQKKDTCQGDSGGPIQIYHKYRHCMYTVLGVTSFGKACGEVNSPGVYTRIHGYLKWIEDRVWPNQ